MLGFGPVIRRGLHVSFVFVRQSPQVPANHGARRRARSPRRPCCARKAPPVKIGVLHPVSGALSYSGQQGRIGAQLAIDEINAAGGIKALGGAKIEAVLGDAQSTPDGGNAEVEKMNGAGVAAIVGGYASAICLSASQTAARYDLPYVVDVGVVDSIVTPRPEEHLPVRPGLRRHRQDRARQSRRPSTSRPASPPRP